MRCEIAHESWLPAVPFWERLDPDKRAVIVDVPMTLKRPHLRNGVHVAGWGTHDLVAKGTWPLELGKRLEREVGRPRMTAERFGPQTASTLLALRDEMLRTTEQMARLATTLLERERWDLFLVVLGTLHRGGHYLWDLSQIDADRLDARTRDLLEGALVELYRAADDFVGQCIARAPDARVVVFAVHGMGPNPGWSDRCADLLAHVLRGGERKAPKTGLLYSIKKRLPWSLVREVTMRLPSYVTDRLVEVWSARMFDWSTTRCFPLPMDHAGYIRLNLAGREPRGIVSQGAEYDALLDELEGAFQSFRDEKTGRPIVGKVHRLRDLAPDGAPHRDGLPDLVLEWSGPRATECEALVSDVCGEIRFASHRLLPSGRCANHTSNAWLVTDGAPGSTRSVAAVAQDLAGANRQLG
jgi:predicted AlkP superfamily phosphohydrolase/phosphomutase